MHTRCVSSTHTLTASRCAFSSRPQVRDLLQSFVNIRRHKIEEGLRMVAQASTIKLNNLAAYEANLIRLNLQGSLNMFLKFSKVCRVVCVWGGAL